MSKYVHPIDCSICKRVKNGDHLGCGMNAVIWVRKTRKGVEPGMFHLDAHNRVVKMFVQFTWVVTYLVKKGCLVFVLVCAI